jgi:hypothetical protein
MKTEEREELFTKCGLNKIAPELNLDDELGRPHGLATYLFWNFVSQEMKSARLPLREDQDESEVITEELVTRVSQQAALAELWLSAVEHQQTLPTREQWGRFEALGKEAQRLCFNVLASKRARQLASHEDGEGNLTSYFEAQLRQLLVPFLADAVVKEGRYKAEESLKDRVRAAIDTSRLLRLLPQAQKWARRNVEPEVAVLGLQDASPQKGKALTWAQRQESRKYNVACLYAFVDALTEAAFRIWGRGGLCDVAELRREMMALTGLKIEDQGVPWQDHRPSLSGAELFGQVWKFLHEPSRQKVRKYAEERSKRYDCPELLSAYDHILRNADDGELRGRIALSGRRAQAASSSGAASSVLVAAVIGSQVMQAAGSPPFWMASLPAVPLLTYLSLAATLRVAWDLSATVSDEAKETVKTFGAEVRSVAETASYEMRSWVVAFGTPIRGALYLAALFLGTFALWLLVTSLRKFWPTWPTPYAHALREEKPEPVEPRVGAPLSLAAEIKRRGQVACLTARTESWRS